MTLSVLLVTMIVTYFIPAATALFTKVNASAWVKQFVTAVLAAANGVIVAGTQIDGSAYLSKEALLLALGSFVLAQATYIGLYQPHKINERLAPNSGLG